MNSNQSNHHLVAATTLALGTGFLIYRSYSKSNVTKLTDNEDGIPTKGQTTVEEPAVGQGDFGFVPILSGKNNSDFQVSLQSAEGSVDERELKVQTECTDILTACPSEIRAVQDQLENMRRTKSASELELTERNSTELNVEELETLYSAGEIKIELFETPCVEAAVLEVLDEQPKEELVEASLEGFVEAPEEDLVDMSLEGLVHESKEELVDASPSTLAFRHSFTHFSITEFVLLFAFLLCLDYFASHAVAAFTVQ